MDLKQLIKMTQYYSYYYGNYNNWGISDYLYDSVGNKYSFMLPLPIYESPVIETTPLPSWYTGTIQTKNVPIRDAWQNANCYMESPFSIIVPYWDDEQKTYVRKNLHTEQVDYDTTSEINIMIGDYILWTYTFRPQDSLDGQTKVGLYRGCGVMFNPYSNKYDLVQKFALETFGGKSTNAYNTVTRIAGPMGLYSPSHSASSPISLDNTNASYIEKREITWPYNSFFNFLIDADLSIPASLSGYCYYDYAYVTSIVEDTTL